MLGFKGSVPFLDALSINASLAAATPSNNSSSRHLLQQQMSEAHSLLESQHWRSLQQEASGSAEVDSLSPSLRSLVESFYKSSSESQVLHNLPCLVLP